MYRNFICYRGGSSGGIFFGEEIYKQAKDKENIIGKTYYSLNKENSAEIRNFLNDPGKYLGSVENVILILTKDFLEGFILNEKPNPDSVTRIEIDEALKNKDMKFIPVVFPDFSWDNVTGGISNKEILSKLWGEDAMRRIVGSPPIYYVFQHKEHVVEIILKELGYTEDKQETHKFDVSYVLESTPSVIPKSVFCGRDALVRPRLQSNTLKETKINMTR